MIAKIILIGNYMPDKQYSMLIFEDLIAEGYKRNNIAVSVSRPILIFGKLGFRNSSLTKWLAYVDKFIVFPINLLVGRLANFILNKKICFHICDHSNAFYLHFLPKNETVITCHDVLAIKTGLGYSDTYCTASKSGKVLQKIILTALSGARKLVAVSDFTLKELIEIDLKPHLEKKWICVHNALSSKFVPMPKEQSNGVLNNLNGINDKKIILHVGSDLERKNRKLLIYLISELKEIWDGDLVFAGEKLNEDLVKLSEKLKVSHRIVQIHSPTNEEIRALYSRCHVMIFPSYSEGFGWPIIEAQACGAPVITSNKPPMMSEVGGNAALYADPDNVNDFVKEFVKFNNDEFRDDIIQLGYENCKRFNFDYVMSQYIKLLKN